MSEENLRICPTCRGHIPQELIPTKVFACPAVSCGVPLHCCHRCNAVNLAHALYCRCCGETLKPFQENLANWNPGWKEESPDNCFNLEFTNIQSPDTIQLPNNLSDSVNLEYIAGHFWLFDGMISPHPFDGVRENPFKGGRLADWRHLAFLDPATRKFQELYGQDIVLEPDEELLHQPSAAGHWLAITSNKRVFFWPLSNLGRRAGSFAAALDWRPPDDRRLVGPALAIGTKTLVVASVNRDLNMVQLHILQLHGKGAQLEVRSEEKRDVKVPEADYRRVYLSHDEDRENHVDEVYLASTRVICRYRFNAGQLLNPEQVRLQEKRPVGPVRYTRDMFFFEACKEQDDDVWEEEKTIERFMSWGFREDFERKVFIYNDSEDICRSHWVPTTTGRKLFLVGQLDLRLYERLNRQEPDRKQVRQQAGQSIRLGPLVAVSWYNVELRHRRVELLNFLKSGELLTDTINIKPRQAQGDGPMFLGIGLNRVLIGVKDVSLSQYTLLEYPFQISGSGYASSQRNSTTATFSSWEEED